MTDKPVIHAYRFDASGSVIPIEFGQSVNLTERHSEYDWVHLCAKNPATRRVLEQNSDLDPIVIDAMLAQETRPRALIKPNGAMIILYAMNFYEGEDPEDMISIRIWVDDHKVITARQRDILAIHDIHEAIAQGAGPLSPCDLLIMITDRLFERMEPVLEELEECISRAEEFLLTEELGQLPEDAAVIRKRTVIFMRFVTPQKLVLETILKADLSWMSDEHRAHLAESLDRVTRYVEELQELRDRSLIINDEISKLSGRRLNETSYIFSVAAAVFLPLSFLTGLMGVNLGGMPGTDSGDAFWAFVGLCGLIITIQVLIFKKMKWF